MALDVGELVAYLRLNDSDFQAKTSRATSTWGGLSNSLKSGATTAATALGVTAAAATGLAVNVAKTGLAYNGLQQNSRAALKTLLGGAEQANAQMDKLDAFAKTSPFAKSVFITAQQQLIGFGMAAEKVIPTLDAVQNAVAATGGSGQQLSELVYVLAQIQSAGKVTATDLMQLGQRGVDAATIVGSQMGKTGAEIRDMITKGKISAEDFISYLTTGMAEKFGGATAAIKQQWDGAADRIKGATRDIGAAMTQMFINPDGGGYAVEWGNAIADVLRTVEDKAKTLASVIEGRMGYSFKSVTADIKTLNEYLELVDPQVLVDGWDRLKEYRPIIAGLSGAVAGLSGSVLAGVPILGRFAGAFNPVLLGIGSMIAASPQARNAVERFVKALAPAASDMGKAGKAAIDLAMNVGEDLTPAFNDVLQAAARVINAMSPLVPAFVNVLVAAEPLVEMAAQMVSSIAGLPTPVLAAAAAMMAFNKAIAMMRTSQAAGDIFRGVAEGASRVKTVLSAIWSVPAATMSAYNGGLTRTSAALAGVSQAGSVAGGALSGLLAGINPLGLAVGGATVAFGLFAAAQAKAAEKTQHFNDLAEKLQSTLNETTGAVTNLTLEDVAQDIEQSDIAGALDKAGVSARDFAEAIAAGDAATASFIDQVMAVNAETIELSDSDAVAARKAAENVNTRKQLQEVSQTYADALNKTKESQERANEAAEAAEQTAAGYAKQLKEAKQAADDLNAANLSLSQHLDRQAELLGRASEKMAQYGQVAVGSDGWFDRATEGGRAYNEQIRNMVENYAGIREQMEKTGATGAQIRQTFASQREELVGVLTQMTGSADMARQMVDQIMKIDGKTIRTEAEMDIAAALKSGEVLEENIEDLHGEIKIGASTIPAETTLGELIGDVNQLTGTVEIDGETYPADMSFQQFVDQVIMKKPVVEIDGSTLTAENVLADFLTGVNTATGTMTINGSPVPANESLTKMLGIIDNADGTITINGDDGPVTLAKDSVKISIDKTTGAVTITGNDQASGTLTTIQTNLNNLHDKTVTVRINQQTVMTTVGSGPGAQRAIMEADGGYVGPVPGRHRYAADGLATRQAGFAPGGSWITWAEDETNGEWYIPAAFEKRRRSTQILADAAAHFGLALVEKPAKGYANGSGQTVAGPVTASLDPLVLRRALDGMALSLEAGGRRFEAYLTEVADDRIVAASHINRI